MARNSTVHIQDIQSNIVSASRSKYIRNKDKYINNKYNSLFLKDIVCVTGGFVYGICDCDCGEKDVVTGIYPLITGKTATCGCSHKSGNINNSKYDSDEYIGKVYGNLRVIGYYRGEIKGEHGVIWKLKCELCGNYIEMKATHVVNGTTTSCGCALHNRNNKYSNKNLEGTYINGTKIIKVLDKEYTGQFWICECRYCKKHFKVLARKLCSGHTQSCGCLNESIGVREIKNYLDKYNIAYEQEWKTQNLVSQYGYMLRMDFAIKNSDNEVVAFIEYDGPHHTEITDFCYDERLAIGYFKLSDIQDSDKRKNEFCKENNIPLLRIEYNRNANIIIDELDSFINKLKIRKGEAQC